MKKLLTTQSLLRVALILAMAGSLKHLAAIFASIDGDVFMAWLQAIAIDAGLFALAYSIRQRKAAKRDTRPLWFGVVLFTSISVYGNYFYGLLATGANLPIWLTASKPIVLAASLPLLVLYLAEMVSDNAHFEGVDKGRVSAKAPATMPATQDAYAGPIEADNTHNLPKLRGITPDTEPVNLADANEIRKAQKQERIEQLATLLEEQPDASNTELAQRLDVSPGTIRNYKKELNGRVTK